MGSLERDSTDFNASDWITIIESELADVLEAAPLKDGLSLVVRYATLGGGKRIRPLLTVAICHDVGGNPRQLVRPALAIELLHCSSLIHDDLPALDNDDYRRGKLSTHKAYGEAAAILAGDALIGMVAECLSGSECDPSIEAQMYAIVLRAFVKLCSGQYLDLQNSERADSNLEVVHELKTGSLFEASAELAAVASYANQDTISGIVHLGKYLGVYFQLIDDYRDRFGSMQDTGKSKRSDEANDRRTLFSSIGQTEGEAILKERSQALNSIIIDLKIRGVLKKSDAIANVCKLIENGIISTSFLEK